MDVVGPLFFISYVIVGSLIFTWGENWSTWSSVYFCIITLSTVGYGDMTPSTDWTKIVALLYVYIGLFFFTTVIGTIIGRRTTQREVQEGLESDEEEEDGPTWPEVPIEGGPPQHPASPKGYSLYRKDLMRRHTSIAKAVLAIFILISIATIFFSCNEDFSAVDSLYFTMITMSTVGYGDINMKHASTMIFDVFFVIIGVSLLIYFLLTLGALFAKKMRRRMFKIFARKGVTMDVIKAVADPETGKAQRPDFLAYLLVHSGKVKPMDINKVNQLFDAIDCHGTGSVDVSDLKTYMEDKMLLRF